MAQTYKDFSILICLVQIWEVENPNNPLPAPQSPLMITEVENIEIEESYRKIIGTASIRFPRGTVIKKTITQELNPEDYQITATREDSGAIIVTRADSRKAEVADFKIGSRIKIMLGLTSDYKVAGLTKPDSQGKSIFNDSAKLNEYKKYLTTMFDGYITQCSIDHPIEIKCENMASSLKKITCPDITCADATMKDLFAEKGPKYSCNLLKNTGLKLHPNTEMYDIHVGDIELNSHLTVADVLASWSKSGVVSFVKEHDGMPCIAIGRTYFSNPGGDSVIRYGDGTSAPTQINFNYHVAKNDLRLTKSDLLFLAVEATGLDKQGKMYRITIRRNPNWNGESGDDKYQLLNEVKISKKAQQAGVTALSQNKDRVDLSTYTILPYVSKKMGIDHEELVEEAKKYFETCNQNGVEGTLTLFGDLALKTGSVVELNDTLYPEKNGLYLVDEVYTTFGVNGYRQRIKLPYRLSKSNNQ